MDLPEQESTQTINAGLCETCRHRRWIHNGRGSRFLLCLAHKTNPDMPRYPALPVLECAVYETRE